MARASVAALALPAIAPATVLLPRPMAGRATHHGTHDAPLRPVAPLPVLAPSPLVEAHGRLRSIGGQRKICSCLCRKPDCARRRGRSRRDQVVDAQQTPHRQGSSVISLPHVRFARPFPQSGLGACRTRYRRMVARKAGEGRSLVIADRFDRARQSRTRREEASVARSGCKPRFLLDSAPHKPESPAILGSEV